MLGKIGLEILEDLSDFCKDFIEKKIRKFRGFFF